LLDAELVEGYDLRRSLDLVAFFNRLRVLSPNTIPLTDEAAKAPKSLLYYIII
jgi:hypothetical protein